MHLTTSFAPQQDRAMLVVGYDLRCLRKYLATKAARTPRVVHIYRDPVMYRAHQFSPVPVAAT